MQYTKRTMQGRPNLGRHSLPDKRQHIQCIHSMEWTPPENRQDINYNTPRRALPGPAGWTAPPGHNTKGLLRAAQSGATREQPQRCPPPEWCKKALPGRSASRGSSGTRPGKDWSHAARRNRSQGRGKGLLLRGSSSVSCSLLQGTAKGSSSGQVKRCDGTGRWGASPAQGKQRTFPAGTMNGASGKPWWGAPPASHDLALLLHPAKSASHQVVQGRPPPGRWKAPWAAAPPLQLHKLLLRHNMATGYPCAAPWGDPRVLLEEGLLPSPAMNNQYHTTQTAQYRNMQRNKYHQTRIHTRLGKRKAYHTMHTHTVTHSTNTIRKRQLSTIQITQGTQQNTKGNMGLTKDDTLKT